LQKFQIDNFQLKYFSSDYKSLVNRYEFEIWISFSKECNWVENLSLQTIVSTSNHRYQKFIKTDWKYWITEKILLKQNAISWTFLFIFINALDYWQFENLKLQIEDWKAIKISIELKKIKRDISLNLNRSRRSFIDFSKGFFYLDEGTLRILSNTLYGHFTQKIFTIENKRISQ